jgi:hypothetical protein
MKKILISITIFVLAFQLSGCLYQSVDSDDIEQAKAFCNEKGASVYKILSHFTGSEYVICTLGKGGSFIKR